MLLAPIGAVFGPWLGGHLLDSGHGDWGFTAFALTGVFSMVLIGIASLRKGPGTAARNMGPAVPAAH